MYGRMHWNRRTRLGRQDSGKRIYAWRKETIERSFAEAKELHGLRYARMLGIRNMYEQPFLTAAVQNMKRIARAFRSLFSVLPYAFRGCFQKKASPFVGGLGGGQALPVAPLGSWGYSELPRAAARAFALPRRWVRIVVAAPMIRKR